MDALFCVKWIRYFGRTHQKTDSHGKLKDAMNTLELTGPQYVSCFIIYCIIYVVIINILIYYKFK